MDETLSVEHFEQFFTELWTRPDAPSSPFPWQSELVRQVEDQHQWPQLVDLPTGSGKTSLLEIAVFLLALDADRPVEKRWMPRRTVLVVDRRVVVDQAEARGATIAKQLGSPAGDVCRRVADRLERLSDGGPALVTTVLRGGIVRDESWARRPDVPALISSTVDQVGSRSLFRGYGISRRMRPVHAGLLANDVLFLLDEVHLARPFAETLNAISGYRTWGTEVASLPDRWHVVELTATPTSPAQRVFPLQPLEPSSHPVLARRLSAPKSARLEVIKVAKDDERANEQFAVGCVRFVRSLLDRSSARTLGVIVNRVDTARRVARNLGELDLDVVLLTGRMRALDKDRVLGIYRSRLEMGRQRAPEDRPLVVVATQSIEAGADFDLDGIVTECASLDALRQRFGRVDRDGVLGASGTPSMSVVAIRSTDVGEGGNDPVYGEALSNTWAWLSNLVDVDFGLQHLIPPPVGSPELERLLPSTSLHAPHLLPLHLDRWVQTSQPPSESEPDIATWLHGVEENERVPDVQLVWRADLDVSLFDAAVHQTYGRVPDEILARVAACPPVSGEALGVTIGDFRRWAGKLPADPTTSDVSGRDVHDLERDARPSHLYLRWFGDTGEFVESKHVRPGDTVIVPSSDGGLQLDNWDPSGGEPVKDLAMYGLASQRRRAVARLGRSFYGPDVQLLDPDELGHESPGERQRQARDLLGRLARQAQDATKREVLAHLANRRTPLQLRAFVDRVDADGLRQSYVASSLKPTPQVAPNSQQGTSSKAAAQGHGDLATDDGTDALSFTGVTHVTLDQHLRGVAGWAQGLARRLGLPRELVDDLGLAGVLHDLGKSDSRFQRRLQGGGPLIADEVLAKSPVPDTDAVARRRAHERSGYPRGARHELLSVAMVDGDDGPLGAAHDPDLVRHLVATHHGFGRYRFEPSLDRAPEQVTFRIGGHDLAASTEHGLHDLASGLPDAFWILVQRYGWFGLTWLETIFRLADHARSRAEQESEVQHLSEEAR